MSAYVNHMNMNWAEVVTLSFNHVMMLPSPENPNELQANVVTMAQISTPIHNVKEMARILNEAIAQYDEHQEKEPITKPQPTNFHMN